MFTLNLLSEKQKKEVRFEIYNRFLIQIGIGLVAIIVVFSVLLIPTFIFLLSQKGDLKHDLEIEQKSQENAKITEAEGAVETNKDIIKGPIKVKPSRKAAEFLRLFPAFLARARALQ